MTNAIYHPRTDLGRWFDPENFWNFEGFDRFPEFRSVAPKANVVEKEDKFVLEVEVPGMKEEDINVEVHNGMLTLKGDRKIEKADEKENYHMKEFSETRFERSFRLGEGVDVENIHAKLENGVLNVTLPKKEEAKPKRIPIKIES